MKSFNGYRSWNAWNVALWINNDESIYRSAMAHIQRLKLKGFNNEKVLRLATKALRLELNYKTPDGAVYNNLSVKNALKEL